MRVQLQLGVSVPLVLKMDFSVRLCLQVDISVSLEPHVDVSMPTEIQVDVSILLVLNGCNREWRRLHNEEPNDLYFSPNIVRVTKSKSMRLSGHVARMGNERGV